MTARVLRLLASLHPARPVALEGYPLEELAAACDELVPGLEAQLTGATLDQARQLLQRVLGGS